MANENVPEDWIGKYVVVSLVDDPDHYNGPLLEVNERGVVVRIVRDEDTVMERLARGEDAEMVRQDVEHLRYFLPWNRIQTIAVRDEAVREEE